MNKGEKHVAIAILLLLVIGFSALIIANGVGYTSILGTWRFPLSETGNGGNGNGGNNNLTDTQKLQAGIGTFQAQVTGEDSADSNTAYTVAADFYVNWYSWAGQYDQFGQKKYSHVLTEIANPTATQDLLDMRPEYNGYIYALVSIPSGAHYSYIDYSRMQEDGYIEGYQFIDVDNSGQQNFLFKYNMKDHYIPGNNFPVITFKVYLMEQDHSFPGITAITNVTTGANQIDKVLKWYYTMSGTKKYIGIYQIELAITTTDLTKVSLKSMEIPGRATVGVSSFHKWQTSTDIRYTITFSESSYDGALYQGLMPNAADNEFDLYTTLTCTLPSDHILVSLTVFYLNAPTMSGASDTESTYLNTT